MINYYVVLEIQNFSDVPTIKKAYRRLSKKYHPDVNKDPFANSYFQKINEAYDFLMDENKRILLHQFLNIQHSQHTTNSDQTKYQERNTQNPQPNAVEIEPVIHFFSADKKHFVLNDHILIQWNVSACKSVHINVFGNVAFSGTHYLKIDHFAEEIIVLMTVVGLNNKEYKYQIKLQYSNKNPTEKAFQKIKSQHPDADEIHFKKETFFGLNARINKNQFKNRMILLESLLIIFVVLFFVTHAKTLVFLLLLILFWVIFGQCYKRIHDTEKYKNKVGLLLIPIYNLLIISKLFVLDSEPRDNEFGMIPKSSNNNFKNWIVDGFKQVNKQLTLLHKLSMGSFVILVVLVLFKSLNQYDETSVNLTSYYIDTSRPNTNGRVEQDYFVVFNDKISVNVSENYFNEIVYKKTFDTYKIALNNNSVEYIRLIDSKSNYTERLNFGVFQSNNPLLLITFLLFLSQLYVWRNLKAPAELKFANGYMVFTMMVYLYAILVTLF